MARVRDCINAKHRSHRCNRARKTLICFLYFRYQCFATYYASWIRSVVVRTCRAMASALGATCRPVRCSKPVVQTPNCVLRGSWSAPSAPIRRGEPQACCCQGADEPRKTDARVQTVRTYNEAQDRLYRAQKVQEEDDDGSIATLVPGGLKSQRSRRGGAAAAEARRERSKPLKINTDLKLVCPFPSDAPVVCSSRSRPNHAQASSQQC